MLTWKILLAGLLCLCAAALGVTSKTRARLVASAAQSKSRTPRSSSGGGAKNIRRADAYPGGDLGAKINAADKDLGLAAGEILVTGGGTISTQAVINSGHTLRFSAGVYRLETQLMDAGAILLKSNTSVVGSGADTIIVEPPKIGWIVFQSFDDARSNPLHSGSDSKINVSNLQVRGANPGVDGGVRQTIALGNCHQCAVEGVWLNATGVIGVQAGGNPLRGNFADTVTIRNNRFTHVASQAAAVVNGRNIVIDGNVFNDSGRCCQIGASPIDIEPNDPGDIAQNIRITDNTIDSRGSGFLHGNGILVQNTARTRGFGPVLVKGNNIIGGDLVPNVTGNIASGIYVTGFTQDVEVTGNRVQRVAHSGIRLENSTRNRVSGNTLVSTGSGGTLSFEINNTTDSFIYDNIVAIDPNSPAATDVMWETGTTSRNNSYRGNRSGKGALTPVTLRP